MFRVNTEEKSGCTIKRMLIPDSPRMKSCIFFLKERASLSAYVRQKQHKGSACTYEKEKADRKGIERGKESLQKSG